MLHQHWCIFQLSKISQDTNYDTSDSLLAKHAGEFPLPPSSQKFHLAVHLFLTQNSSLLQNYLPHQLTITAKGG